MENKKLLKFLLKDLTEIEELMLEKGSSGFDPFELEFIETRFKGAKQIIQILNEKEGAVSETKVVNGAEKPVQTEIAQEKSEREPEDEVVTEEKVPEIVLKEEQEKEETLSTPEHIVVATEEEKKEEVAPQPFAEIQEKEPELVAAEGKEELELGEEVEELESRRLGDSFLKEKSLNDLLGNGSTKLESKLQNSPVSSIQRAIGINDRYQYIRELFDGSAEAFSKTVEEIDGLPNIHEAVNYLQQNYKWKKTDTSLKFVNLVKRRFLNE